MSSIAALPAGRATYGRRREATPLSDSEAPSSSIPKIFETSPANKKKNLIATSDEDVDTASTTASGSEDESHARKRSAHRPQSLSTKRLNFLDDSEELSDEADATVQPGSSINADTVLAQSSANGGDAVSRLREKMGAPPRASLKASQSSGGGRSEQYTSSLSSAPPLTQDRSSRQAESSSSSGSDADGEDFGASLIRGSRRGGAMAGRMKKRTAGQESGSARPSTSTTTTAKGLSRPALLLSDEEPSSSPPSSLSSLDQLHRQRVIAVERKARLTELAASKKKQDQPSLEDEFFGQIQDDDAKRDDPIRSSSSHAYDDDDDDIGLPEISDMIRPKEPEVKEGKARSSSSKPRKHKEKGPKAPKQLSKKELDEMHKMSAKIERSRPVPSLSLQSHPVQRQQFDFSHLAAKFKDDPDRSLIESQDTEDPTTSDPIVVETPRFASNSVTRESQPSPTQERMLYGNPEAFPPRLTAGPDASLPESQQGQPPPPSLELRQRKVKAAALQLRKQQWLEAQAAAQGPAPAVKARDDDFQIIDRPSGTNSKTQGRKSAPAALTKASFNVSLQDKIRLQNIKARSLREQNHRSQQQPQVQSGTMPTEKAQQGDDSMEELKRIQQRVERLERAGEPSRQEGMEDESDDSEDGDFVLDENEARGSGSESEEEVVVDPDQAPPSSQRSLPSSGSARRPELDDEVEEVDEDEDDADDTAVAFPSSRTARARRAVLDDEDLVEDVDANDSSHNSKQDSGISSISTGNSAPGFTQFFQDTQQSGGSQQELPESQRPFITSPDELPTTGARLGRRPMGSAHRESDGSFGFGQFFQDTQLSQASRGESLDVIGATGRAKNAEITSFLNLGEASGGIGGLSQFFEDDTQAPMPVAPTSAAQAGQMLPPTGIRTDGFAALRKAAQGDNDLLLSPASLPSNDDFLDDEEEMLAAGIALPSAQAAASRNPRQYLNREGFFTQTKPSFGSQWQPSQSQTDGDEMGRRRPSAAESLDSIDAEAEPSSTRKKRFRRAAAPEDEDEAEPSEADQEEEEEPQDEASNADPVGSSSEEEDEEALLAGSGSDEEEAAAIQPGATRNAWDILRQGAANVDAHGKARDEAAKHKKKRDYNDFIEGEALESDEEDEGARKKHGAGGLGGIFSDDGSGSDEDEEDDGRDLEELVNNEREKDELEKDVLARERYYQDLEADDKALMALADKATRGELRKKKRRGDGLEDLLEDDFDEDRLMRRANNPRALMPKRRKIEGDEMDLLASKEESMAFVRGYADTTQQADGNDYSFLQDEDKSEADQHSDDDDERSSIDANSHQDQGEADEDEEDEFTSRRITRKDFASELRERRRRKVLLDDDDEPSPSGGANEWGGIDESPERVLDPFALHEDAPRASSFKELPSFVRDRLSGSTKSLSRSKEDLDHDLEDEEESRPFQRLPSLSRPSRSQRAASPRTEARLKRVAEEFNSQPDFENRAAVAGGGGRKGLNPGGRSITSFGQQQQRSTSNGMGKGLSSRLTGDGPMKARVKSSGDTVLLKQRRVVDESQ